MIKYLQQHKHYLIFICIILLMGLLSGIIYYILLDNTVKENISTALINYNTFKCNNILKDLIIMSLLFVTSIFLIGVPLNLLYLLYEGLALGLTLSIFTVNFGFSGIIYFIFFFLINKLLVLFIMSLYIKRLFNVSRLVIGFFIYKRDVHIKNKLIVNLCNSLYFIVIIFIVNIFIYFISDLILRNLDFLLK